MWTKIWLTTEFERYLGWDAKSPTSSPLAHIVILRQSRPFSLSRLVVKAALEETCRLRDERWEIFLSFPHQWLNFVLSSSLPKTIKGSHEAFSKTPQIQICISWYRQDFPKDWKSLTAKMRHGRGEVVHQFFRMSDWLRPDEQLDLIWPQATRTRKMKGENCRNADENEGSLVMPYLRTD